MSAFTRRSGVPDVSKCPGDCVPAGVSTLARVGDIPRYSGCDGVSDVLKCVEGCELKCAGGGVLAGVSKLAGVGDMPR